jgi:hypothetical protein
VSRFSLPGTQLEQHARDELENGGIVMSYSFSPSARSISFLWFVLLMPACGNGGNIVNGVAARARALDLACGALPADFVGDFLSIPASIEPLDPARPQAYGSDECAAFVFEFDNPEKEQLRGAWVQAGGESRLDEGVLSEDECFGRTLEVDYWGYEDREWSILASARMSGSFESGEQSGTGYCKLDLLFDHPTALEKLRVVARVAQGSETYPMYACLW